MQIRKCTLESKPNETLEAHCVEERHDKEGDQLWDVTLFKVHLPIVLQIASVAPSFPAEQYPFSAYLLLLYH